MIPLRKAITLAVLLMATPVSAGQLVVNATIIEVANTYGNAQDFAIKLSGGAGVCSGSVWVIFPEAKKQSDASYQQSFSIALSAFATGSKVRIHNFEDDSCFGANFISIIK